MGTAFALLLAAIALACSSGAATSAPLGSATSTESPAGSAIELPAGFPIGTWTTTITAEDLLAIDPADLAAIGMSEQDLVKENAGRFSTTFAADGTWSTLQESDQPVKWPVFRGTFTPVGADAFDQVTTFPPDFAGDVVRFNWRIDDGLLYLTVPEPLDPIMPIVTEAHPWSPVG
jgi:hypothetical protein